MSDEEDSRLSSKPILQIYREVPRLTGDVATNI